MNVMRQWHCRKCRYCWIRQSQNGPLIKGCLLHRLGVVPVAEASVVIGIATPHRGDAFEACRFLIDQLKIQVPIWKKEHYADGKKEWVMGKGKPEIK